MNNGLACQISFECFPPKTEAGLANFKTTALALSHYRPDFFSVTFGAGGSTRDGTFCTVNTLQQLTNMNIVPHLSCIGLTREQLATIVQQYQSMGVKRIVALRGDLPSGMGQSGEFQFASDLVKLIRDISGDYFHIDVAAYPEIHPQTRNVRDDILNLKRKCEAGADSAITQYFFNPDAYFYYLDDCARYGIAVPIVPGIMPITQFTKLSRFSNLCGAEIPLWIRKRLESFGDDIDAIYAFGLEVIYHLCERLIAGGAPGLHFYTLNKSTMITALLEALNVAPISNSLNAATIK
ncbi:MAG: methylenetetrahydrofolate reductase [NAD(P)H] [Gammaproteobacteria bacterium RIFCSPHIGHO2_12_FULL_42_10]|nr:MAG: methylenetetrahydrofolate reductase [NAD(P)H] [Gammaproteobacteria bacterium RIFCSPHIGHO2_12_FULL_42_10]